MAERPLWKEPVGSERKGAEARANLVKLKTLLIELEQAVSSGDEAKIHELHALVEEVLRASRLRRAGS
jgi:hypothetical protein